MCGRYIAVSNKVKIEKKFQVSCDVSIRKNYNVSPGQLAPIINSDKPNRVQLFHFGFTPFWSKKKTYIINARAEGDNNKIDDPLYKGGKGIITKPYFRKSIRYKRCLVIADAFIEGTVKEKLDNPYLVYLRNKQRPFAMAGIYDEWVDTASGETYQSFAIITCPSNSLMQKIPHKRMPVILHPSDYKKYLSLETELSTITNLLNQYDSNLMNAYSISNQIKNSSNNNKELLLPLDQSLIKEYSESEKNEWYLSSNRKDTRRNSLYGDHFK